jgi:hypothetical protein
MRYYRFVCVNSLSSFHDCLSCYIRIVSFFISLAKFKIRIHYQYLSLKDKVLLPISYLQVGFYF